jgi:glyoxylate reductase
MRPTVVLTDPLIPAVVERDLRPHARVQVVSSRAGLLRLLPKADGLITLLSDRVDAALLAAAPRLKVVGNFAVGYDNLDRAACHARGVRVVNTPGVLDRSTAELALALLLAAARRLPEGDALCRKGRFAGWAPELLLGLELRGRRALIVGKGRIGGETARLFAAVGLEVRSVGSGSSAAEIARELKAAQVVSLHLPYSAATLHWLSKERLALLPRDAIVINTARGPVLDEKALIAALRARRLFAAGLDVFEREPEIPLALRRLPNAVLLPHLGSATTQAREAMARLAIAGVLAVLRGEAPPNEVRWEAPVPNK